MQRRLPVVKDVENGSVVTNVRPLQTIPQALRSYRFVKPARIANPGSTILMSEWCRDWRMLAGTDPYDSSDNKMCLSYLTVHGYAAQAARAPRRSVRDRP